jgi:L-threonylcarbamoyladenylate synthase
MLSNNLDEEKLENAGKCIRNGGIVVFPTETVYGLGANSLDSNAVLKIFEAKGRPQDNPLIIHVSNFSIEKYVKKIPDIARKLMEKFWPGPLTIIMEKTDLVSSTTSAGLNTIGVRMPSNKIALKLIEYSGVPIAAPSANISGRPSPTNIQRCIEDLDGKIEYIIGGEECNVGVESTIIDCTVEPPCVLRPGGITLEMLREFDENIYIDKAIMSKPKKDLKPKAPGMKYRHYAPKAPLKIVDGDLNKTVEKINEIVQYNICNNKSVGIICTDEAIDKYDKRAYTISLGKGDNLEIIATKLFDTLRKMDDRGVDVILSQGFEQKGIGIAIMNRLNKAAGFDIVKV